MPTSSPSHPFKGDHDADLSYIEAAAKGIAPQLSGGELVVLESTAPPGATEFMAEVILGLRPELTMEPNLPNSLYFSHARSGAARPHHGRDARERSHHRRSEHGGRRAEP